MKKIVTTPTITPSTTPNLPVKAPRVTLSLRFRELILAGKTDSEIYAQIKTEFPTFGQKKTHNRYAAWYRSEMKSAAKNAE